MPSAAAVRFSSTSAPPSMPQLVRCDRRNLSLTAAGCARMWEAAQAKRPGTWEGCFACVACPVGAARAGKPLTAAEVFGEALKGVCVRCQEPHDRLICEGRFCPNCYNRDREHRIGRNRKGGTPRLKLRSVRMMVRAGVGRPEVHTATRVTGTVEAMLLTAKRSNGGAIMFGVPPATLPELLMEEVPAAPLCTDLHGIAAGGTPGSSPKEGAESHLDVERPANERKPCLPGGAPVDQPPRALVRQRDVLGSLRWLLQGTTGFLSAGRIAAAPFDAMLPFKLATLAELRGLAE